MSNYELYEKVLEAYKSGDEGLFNASARNWIEGAESANFNNDEADELFGYAKRCCNLWRTNAINGRISKRRMIEAVGKIAAMELPNPYLKEEPKKVIAEEPVKVLGVLPTEPELEPIAKPVEMAEEKKDEKQHFFGRKNKK